MVEEILNDIKKLRDEIAGKLASSKLSNIILKYEDKLKGLDDMDPISEDDD